MTLNLSPQEIAIINTSLIDCNEEEKLQRKKY